MKTSKSFRYTIAFIFVFVAVHIIMSELEDRTRTYRTWPPGEMQQCQTASECVVLDGACNRASINEKYLKEFNDLMKNEKIFNMYDGSCGDKTYSTNILPQPVCENGYCMCDYCMEIEYDYNF